MRATQIETITKLLSKLPKDRIIKEVTDILWAGKFTNDLTEDIIAELFFLTQQTKK